MTENASNTKKDAENGDNNEVVYKPLSYEISKQELLVAENGKGKKDSFFLYFSSLTADLIMFACGCTFVWSSPAMSRLESTDPDINPLGVPVTHFQAAWIVAIPTLGTTVGPLIFGKVADVVGRKNTLIFLIVLKLISYVILAFATHIYLYYLTRFILGVALGISFSVMPIYTGEICEDHNRGKFACIMAVFVTLGILYTLAVGPLLSVKLFALSCTIPLVIALICFILIIPDSPVYLASVGKFEDAKKSLMKFRNQSVKTAETDLVDIIRLIDESSSTKGRLADLLKEPALRKGLIICIGLCSLQNLAGVNPIMAFIGPIFELTGSNIPTNLSTILIAAVQTVAIAVSSIGVEKLGRKILLLFSIIMTMVSLIVLGFYFYLQSIEFHYIHSLFWLPITSLIVYIVSFNIGLGPVPWAVLGEVFPSNVRYLASSLATCSGAIAAFFVTFLFPFIMKFLGLANCFWLFGAFCALGAIFICLVVPETKGKNIVEIQELLRKTKK